jgi:hypothetical protein
VAQGRIHLGDDYTWETIGGWQISPNASESIREVSDTNLADAQVGAGRCEHLPHHRPVDASWRGSPAERWSGPLLQHAAARKFRAGGRPPLARNTACGLVTAKSTPAEAGKPLTPDECLVVRTAARQDNRTLAALLSSQFSGWSGCDRIRVAAMTPAYAGGPGPRLGRHPGQEGAELSRAAVDLDRLINRFIIKHLPK